jgi:hypothetical protein
MTPGEERLAQTQRRFRRANERLQACVVERVADDLPIPFLCECTDDACLEPVHVTLAEYRSVRTDDARFLVAKGHRTVGGESLGRDGGSYVAVENWVS